MKYNSYGEVIDNKDYEKLEYIFNKEVLTEQEKKIIENKTRCACGLILSISGIKAHVSSSIIHKKRMEKFNLTDYYVHPKSPYSRLQKTITIHKEKVVINFD
tara:strand:+ start:4166 stop:4471 length:306 start_codon:yes stop_codon:yes gene_type:complete